MRKETGVKGFVKWFGVCLSVIIAVSVIGSGAYGQDQGEWTGNINVLIGQKWLDKEDWEPVDKLFQIGVQTDFRPVEWPVSIAADLVHGWAEETVDMFVYDPYLGYMTVPFNMEATGTEVHLGIRYIYEELQYLRPFIGVGPALMWATYEGSAYGYTVSDSDFTLGFWLGGGAYVTLAEHLNLGIQTKYSYGKVELFDIDGEVGGWHVGGLIGFHW